MIIAQYDHRLPADYDVGSIRTRAKERGPGWDEAPALYFKAFLLRETGRHGAIANNYSSLYLWRREEAFCDFLVDGRYKVVTDAFGRPEIRTRVVLDVRKGRAEEARFAVLDEADIPLGADLTAVLAGEVETNREIAGRPGTVVAAIGIDTQAWRVTRILLTDHEPTSPEIGTAYEILHLARPLLDTLPA